MRRHEIGVEESMRRILSTALLGRVMRPWFGSRLFELVDRSMDAEWRVLFIAYICDALERNEERIRVEQVVLESVEPMRVMIRYEERGEIKEMSYAAK